MIKVDKIETQKPFKAEAVTNAIIKKGFSPYIENGYWYEYDEAIKLFVNTGVIAKGKDGVNGKDGKNGLNGKDGYTPMKGIDYRDGIDGKDGKNGIDGYTPIKGIDYNDGKDGIDGKDGKDGINGIDGKNGKDGYTPVKGTDYWTEADKTEIENYCKDYIDTNITNAIGGEY